MPRLEEIAQIREQNPKLALQKLQVIMSAYSEHYETLDMVGQVSYELNLYDLAEKSLQQALRLRQHGEQSKVVLGLTLFKLGEHKEAHGMLAPYREKPFAGVKEWKTKAKVDICPHRMHRDNCPVCEEEDSAKNYQTQIEAALDAIALHQLSGSPTRTVSPKQRARQAKNAIKNEKKLSKKSKSPPRKSWRRSKSKKDKPTSSPEPDIIGGAVSFPMFSPRDAFAVSNDYLDIGGGVSGNKQHVEVSDSGSLELQFDDQMLEMFDAPTMVRSSTLHVF
eukprot:m.272990 g.272990  ORF g.272990 m.272990 type:complete len:278 (-) comp104772_c0_seq1:445-1278(-)